jgi:hypothetical protein
MKKKEAIVMDYVTKSFRNILGIFVSAAMVLLVFFLFVNILPVIFSLGLITYIVYKSYKVIKLWNKNRSGFVTPKGSDEFYNKEESEEFFNGEIIDVEYKELD